MTIAARPNAVPTAIVTGSGGLIGSEASAHFVRAGSRRRRHRQRHARAVLRGRGLDRAHDRSGSSGARRRVPLARRSTSATPRPSTRVRPRRRRDRARRSTPPRSRRTTGRRAIRSPTSPSTPIGTLNLLEATRAARPDGDVHLHARRTRSTATRRTRCRWSSSRRALELPEDHRYHGGHRHDDVDRRLACTRCSAPRRSPPTCWCRSTAATSACRPSCFRGGCLTGPNHSGDAAARLPLLPDALHDDRHAVHGLRLQRQAGPRQHPLAPTWSARFDGLPRAPRAAAVYNIGGGRHSNCSMLEAIALVRGDRRRASSSWTLTTRPAIGDHLWWISDLEPFQRDYPGWKLTLRRSRRSCARSTTANAERWQAAREALDRHPRARRGRVDRRDGDGGARG